MTSYTVFVNVKRPEHVICKLDASLSGKIASNNFTKSCFESWPRRASWNVEYMSSNPRTSRTNTMCRRQGVTTVRLDLGKKYDTELRTEFLEKVRYGNMVLYFPYRTILFPYSSNARFALLLPSAALFLLAYDFTPSVALPAHTHHQSTFTIF